MSYGFKGHLESYAGPLAPKYQINALTWLASGSSPPNHSSINMLLLSTFNAQPEQNQDSLVLRAIEGDHEAFGALYTLHLNAIYRYIYFRVGDEEEAENLTEQVFVKAWEELPGYRLMDCPLTGWLYRIAHDLTVDCHRTRSRASLSDLDLHSMPAAPSPIEGEQIMEDGQTLGALASAVQELDDEEQEIVILRFVQGLPHGDVAAATGRSVNATRVIQYRALAKLSIYLKSRDGMAQ